MKIVFIQGCCLLCHILYVDDLSLETRLIAEAVFIVLNDEYNKYKDTQNSTA
jgi:hypothetical protein